MRTTLAYLALLCLPCAFGSMAYANPSGSGAQIASLKIIDTAFEPILRENIFLMEQGGAKFIHLPGGTNAIFAVGMTDIRTDAPNPVQEKLRQRTIADSKARKAVAEAIHGIHVYSFVQTTERTIAHRRVDLEEVIEDLTELLERSESQTRGLIPGIPVVATWTMPDEGLFCLAIGRTFSRESKEGTPAP